MKCLCFFEKAFITQGRILSARFNIIQPHFFCNQKKPSKACEARPVDDEASRVWRRGQNIQGVCRRIFWVPQEYAPERKVQTPNRLLPQAIPPLKKGGINSPPEDWSFRISTAIVQADGGFSFYFFSSVVFLQKPPPIRGVGFCPQDKRRKGGNAGNGPDRSILIQIIFGSAIFSLY